MKYIQDVGNAKFYDSSKKKEFININMMPFCPSSLFSTLPKNIFDQYGPLIVSCFLKQEDLLNTCYLTISESTQIGNSQRRGGIHVEKHPSLSWGGGHWGSGSSKDGIKGGIYMASTLDNTCRAWDTQIEEPGEMGDCSEFEEFLDEPVYMEAEKLYWMTDATPHESLPHKGFRRFFRLVTSNVSIWYAKHSTSNPKGWPVPKHVKIIEEYKLINGT